MLVLVKIIVVGVRVDFVMVRFCINCFDVWFFVWIILVMLGRYDELVDIVFWELIVFDVVIVFRESNDSDGVFIIIVFELFGIIWYFFISFCLYRLFDVRILIWMLLDIDLFFLL